MQAQKTLLGCLQYLEKMREEEGFETRTWEVLLECFEAQNGQHLPLFWQKPAKNNKLMLVGNDVNTNKHLEISVSNKQKIYI
jgi:hypothetical protein